MTLAKVIPALLMSAGFGMLVGGGYGFATAWVVSESERISANGFGMLDGFWEREDFAFLGVVLSSVGGGIFLFGLALLVIAPRPAGENRRLRRALWIGLLTLSTGAASVAAVALLTTKGATQAERDAALDAAIAYLDSVDNGKEKAELRTESYGRRLDAAPERVAYHFGRWSLGTQSGKPDAAIVHGFIRASGKTTIALSEAGASATKVAFPERKRVDIRVRLLKRDGGWKVDDVEVKE